MDEWSSDELSEDEAYELVAQSLRRETLRVLLNERDEWEVDALAAEVAAREGDVQPDDVDEETHKRVAVALLHRDLPRLDDAGIVEFDFAAETVVTGENIRDLDPLV